MASREKSFKGIRQRIRVMRSFVAQFPYRPDDVVIVSYPKSGSTWLRFMIACLIESSSKADGGEADFGQMNQHVPEISEKAVEAGVNYDLLPSPRVMRTHTAYIKGPPKVLYLVRDGRDVLVSYYHHYRKYRDFKGTFSDYLQRGVRRVEWSTHVDDWVFKRDLDHNFCLIRYEDMLEDPTRELTKVVAFTGLKVTPEQIAQAVEFSAFDNMRRIEDTKGIPYYEQKNPQMRFIRQGRSGGWKEAFSEADKAYFKEQFGGVLVKCGYEAGFQW